MVEKRNARRRQYIPVTRFPLCTLRGDLIESDRRSYRQGA